MSVLNRPRYSEIVSSTVRQRGWVAPPATAFVSTEQQSADFRYPCETTLASACGGGIAGPLPVSVLIGPEGGFAEVERAALLKLPNVVRLALGPRILRADTAAVAALTLVQAVLGDWR